MTAPAVVETVVLAHLAHDLRNATPADLDRIAADWAGLPGRVAKLARHLVDEEFEARQAATHEQDMRAWAALVAAMAPTTRYTATGGAR